jgi:hypothetical protein
MKGAGSLLLTIVLGLVLGALVWLSSYWVFEWDSAAPLGYLLIVAILMLAVSLALPGRPGVISNGFFLGALLALMPFVGLMAFTALLIVAFADDGIQRSFVAVGSLVLAIVLVLAILAGYLRLRRKKVQAAGDREKEAARTDERH